MLDSLKTHILQSGLSYFVLLCVLSIGAALQWQFQLVEYFHSSKGIMETENVPFTSPRMSDTLKETTSSPSTANKTDNNRRVSSELKETTSSISSVNKSISCDKLIQGDPKEASRAEDFMKRNFRRTYLPETYPTLTKNCASYVSTRGYINYTMTKEEELFPLAFSLLIYKHAEQVERLLRAIWRPHNWYCIHIDTKSTNSFKEAIKSISKCFKNVFIHPRSLSVNWGTFSVLEPELLCMDLLWNQGQKWKYFINLTGQEFPLKTNYELYLILKAYNGSNDISGSYKLANFDRWRGRGSPPHDIKPRKGSVHIAATHEFVNFLLHNRTASDLLKWVRNTDVPDETYFATLNYNPHLKVPGSYSGRVDDGKHGMAWTRYKIWYQRRLCRGKFVRGICIFSVGDLPTLTRSVQMFANKFHFDYDYLAYDCLESWYHGKVAREKYGYLDFNTTMYSERWMVKHHF